MKRLPLLLSVIAIVIAGFALVERPEAVQAPRGVDQGLKEVQEEEHEAIELAVHMGRMQRFHQKWWAAGQAGNAELAGFYLHELEEEMEVIAEGSVVDDGVDVSAQMKIYGVPTIEALEKKLKEEGVKAMHDDAALLANSCTSCHMACGHPYIRIVPPTKVDFPDQDFLPQGK